MPVRPRRRPQRKRRLRVHRQGTPSSERRVRVQPATMRTSPDLRQKIRGDNYRGGMLSND